MHTHIQYAPTPPPTHSLRTAALKAEAAGALVGAFCRVQEDRARSRGSSAPRLLFLLALLECATTSLRILSTSSACNSSHNGDK